MNAHKTVLLKPSAWLSKHFAYEKYDGKVAIDEKIAPLIFCLWKLGIRTTSCCQATKNPFLWHGIIDNTRDKVWILFYSARDAEKFMNYTKDLNRDMWYISSWFEGGLIKVSLYYPKTQSNSVLKAVKRYLVK